MSGLLIEFVCLTGFVFIGWGLWMIWTPLCFIYAGVLLLALAVNAKPKGKVDG